jgi:thiamine pyridinylase
VGPTETLGSIYFPSTVVANTKLHVLPFDQQRQSQPFFVDALGINSQIDPSKAQYAFAFVKLATSAQTMVQSLVPDSTTDNPQYLIPARPSVLAKLASQWQAYEQIQNIVTTHSGTAFRIDSTSRPWLNGTKAAICAAIFNGQQVCVPEVPHPALTHLPVHLMRRV